MRAEAEATAAAERAKAEAEAAAKAEAEAAAKAAAEAANARAAAEKIALERALAEANARAEAETKARAEAEAKAAQAEARAAADRAAADREKAAAAEAAAAERARVEAEAAAAAGQARRDAERSPAAVRTWTCSFCGNANNAQTSARECLYCCERRYAPQPRGQQQQPPLLPSQVAQQPPPPSVEPNLDSADGSFSSHETVEQLLAANHLAAAQSTSLELALKVSEDTLRTQLGDLRIPFEQRPCDHAATLVAGNDRSSEPIFSIVILRGTTPVLLEAVGRLTADWHVEPAKSPTLMLLVGSPLVHESTHAEQRSSLSNELEDAIRKVPGVSPSLRSLTVFGRPRSALALTSSSAAMLILAVARVLLLERTLMLQERTHSIVKSEATTASSVPMPAGRSGEDAMAEEDVWAHEAFEEMNADGRAEREEQDGEGEREEAEDGPSTLKEAGSSNTAQDALPTKPAQGNASGKAPAVAPRPPPPPPTAASSQAPLESGRRPVKEDDRLEVMFKNGRPMPSAHAFSEWETDKCKCCYPYAGTVTKVHKPRIQLAGNSRSISTEVKQDVDIKFDDEETYINLDLDEIVYRHEPPGRKQPPRGSASAESTSMASAAPSAAPRGFRRKATRAVPAASSECSAAPPGKKQKQTRADDADGSDGEEDLVRAAGGYRLFLSKRSQTGYLCVFHHGPRFLARHRMGGKVVFEKICDRAVDAAVAYAKFVHSLAAREETPTEEDGALGGEGEANEPAGGSADAQEEAEGFTLLRSSRAKTGYVGVLGIGGGKYEARCPLYGEEKSSEYLGRYDTALQAAVAVAKYRYQQQEEQAEEEDEDDEEQREEQGEPVAFAEGLQLHIAKKASSTGYKGVYRSRKDTEKFMAFSTSGASKYLGTFDTALDGAIAYARHMQAHLGGGDAHDDELEADDSGRDEQGLAREAEGIQLHLSDQNSTGYLGVYSKRAKFIAQHSRKGLGSFHTAVEAAVAYARFVLTLEADSKDDCDANIDGEDDEVVQKAEGLQLHLSSKGSTGYLGVFKSGSRFEVRYGNKRSGYKALGTFPTAVEGAVAYAKHVEGLGADDKGDDDERGGDDDANVDAPPVVQTEAEGHQLRLSNRALTGYLGVGQRGPGVFRAKVTIKGQICYLGRYPTALKAAIAIAKRLDAEDDGSDEDPYEDDDESEDEEEVKVDTDEPVRQPRSDLRGCVPECTIGRQHSGMCQVGELQRNARRARPSASSAVAGTSGAPPPKKARSSLPPPQPEIAEGHEEEAVEEGRTSSVATESERDAQREAEQPRTLSGEASSSMAVAPMFSLVPQAAMAMPIASIGGGFEGVGGSMGEPPTVEEFLIGHCDFERDSDKFVHVKDILDEEMIDTVPLLRESFGAIEDKLRAGPRSRMKRALEL